MHSNSIHGFSRIDFNDVKSKNHAAQKNQGVHLDSYIISVQNAIGQGRTQN